MITFGRFGNVKDKEKEKEEFLNNLNLFLYQLSDDIDQDTKYSELEIIKPLKEKLKKQKQENSFSFRGFFYNRFFNSFLHPMGISYYNITPEEKDEILEMDFTYENWEKKSLDIINSFVSRIKNECPNDLSFVFDDICFVFHIQMLYSAEYKLKNLLIYIRDYFILNKTAGYYADYRDNEIYEKIKRRVFKEYPKWKEKYGMNRFLEKLLSYILTDTDYSYEKTKKMLDNYYNKNNKIEDNESIKLKDKQD